MTLIVRRWLIYLVLCWTLLHGTAPAALAFLLYSLPDTATPTTVLTLSSLANNTLSSNGATFDPRIAGAGKGYREVVVFCDFTFAANPTANTGVDIKFLLSIDGGTTFESSTTSRLPNLTCPVTPSTTATKVGFVVPMPPVHIQVNALNNGTGQSVSGTVKFLPTTTQGL